jgi:hypothetical protein
LSLGRRQAHSSALDWWATAPPGRRPAQSRPGYREEFWILDVDGTRLMIVVEQLPGSPSADVAERDAILDSIRIEP